MARRKIPFSELKKRIDAKYSSIREKVINPFQSIAGTDNKLGIKKTIIDEVYNKKRGNVYSERELEKKFKDDYQLSDRERKELKEIIFDDGSKVKPLTNLQKRKLKRIEQRKAKMLKHQNISDTMRSRGEGARAEHDRKRKERLSSAYSKMDSDEKKVGTAKDYGYKTVEDEGHHQATALGDKTSGGSASVVKGGGGGVVKDSGAKGLTGGGGGVAKGGRPLGL